MKHQMYRVNMHSTSDSLLQLYATAALLSSVSLRLPAAVTTIGICSAAAAPAVSIRASDSRQPQGSHVELSCFRRPIFSRRAMRIAWLSVLHGAIKKNREIRRLYDSFPSRASPPPGSTACQGGVTPTTTTSSFKLSPSVHDRHLPSRQLQHSAVRQGRHCC